MSFKLTIGGAEVTDPVAAQAGVAALEAQLAARPAPPVFAVNGVESADFAAVQAHIVALESAESARAADARRAFVAGLSDDRRILASAVDSLTEFALSLTDGQYSAWTATFETVAPPAALARHAGQRGAVAPEVDSGKSSAAAEIVAALRNVMTQEELERTPAWQELQASTSREAQK